jgi:hypothetical protein
MKQHARHGSRCPMLHSSRRCIQQYALTIRLSGFSTTHWLQSGSYSTMNCATWLVDVRPSQRGMLYQEGGVGG